MWNYFLTKQARFFWIFLQIPSAMNLYQDHQPSLHKYPIMQCDWNVFVPLSTLGRSKNVFQSTKSSKGQVIKKKNFEFSGVEFNTKIFQVWGLLTANSAAACPENKIFHSKETIYLCKTILIVTCRENNKTVKSTYGNGHLWNELNALLLVPGRISAQSMRQLLSQWWRTPRSKYPKHYLAR